MIIAIFTAEQVAAQIRSIMSSSFPSTSHSSWNPIPRHPKQKGKSEIAAMKYKRGTSKGKQKLETFQRKLAVFRYMGQNVPLAKNN